MERTKGLSRQLRACRVCRARKVKCDRIRPCHACCAHGYPSKCVYDLSEEEVQPISQADEIQNLRYEIRDLRARIEGKLEDSTDQDLERLGQLEDLFDNIRSAPQSIADDIVREIRTTNKSTNSGNSFFSPLTVRRRTEAGSSSSELDDDSDEECISNSSDSSASSMSMMNPQAPVTDAFVQRFVDAFSPEVDMKSGRAGALRAAAGIRMFSPLISDAFEAVSVAFFGRSVQDKRIESSGFRLYPRVLRGLQDALNDPERCKSESTLVTVILLLAFESVEHTTQRGVPSHVAGAVRLIEHRGPENHMYGVEHLLFTELRPYWIGGAIALRKPTYLAREEWKTIPWSAGTSKKDILHHMLDLAVEIPSLLAQSDEFREAQKYSIMGAQEIAVKQISLCNKISKLTADFDQWYIDWVVHNTDGPIQEVEQTEDQGFPIFRRRDLCTGAIYQSTKLLYPNLLLAQTMCVYYAMRLILSSIDTRGDRVTPVQQYEFGCGICRTYEWYILTAPGNMINRLAFPTRVAWEAFPDHGPERAFLVQVLQLVEKRHSLGLWGGNMAELSTNKDSPLNVS